MKTTANTTFYSKSTSIGSMRWRFELPPEIPRGYLLDMSFQPHLPARWYTVALQLVNGLWQFRVNMLGSANEVSLEESDLQVMVLGVVPIMLVPLDVTDPEVAMERFERVVANLMHNLLEPTTVVAKFWQRFATTNGNNVYTA